MSRIPPTFFVFVCMTLAVFAQGPTKPQPATAKPEPIQFNRDVRPILSDHCFACHGPDEATREADLRLDDRDSALEFSVVPGRAKESELYLRLVTDDRDELMPPPESHQKQLDKEETEIIRRWIDEGAVFEEHWAFAPPKVEASESGSIDAFIARKLKRRGLGFASPADPAELLRRVTFDLTGLPPTPEEYRAFLASPDEAAYEAVVERLLASPAYGEHMARYWLDAVRYADTHGLHFDNYREMWVYRDWVISAFANNKPYDEFAREQIAGDLIPNSTREQLIASGFNRCHVTTNEGGSILEEVRVRNVYDRVDAFGTIFLGLTLGCAKCHDHKFDPISQKEYFQLYAYFNSLDSKAMDDNAKAPMPVIRVPSASQEERLAAFAADLVKYDVELAGPLPQIDAAQAEWEKTWAERSSKAWTVPESQEAKAKSGAKLVRLDDGSWLVSGANPAKDVYELVIVTDLARIEGIRVEAIPDASLPAKSVGRASNGNAVLSEVEVSASPKDLFSSATGRIVQLVEAHSTHDQKEFRVDQAIDGEVGGRLGWAVDGHGRVERKAAFFSPSEPFGYDGGTRVHLRLHFASIFDQHHFGRFRVSLTRDAGLNPVVLEPWQKREVFRAKNATEAFDRAFGPEETHGRGQNRPDPRDPKKTPEWKSRPDLADGLVHAFDDTVGAHYLLRRIHCAESMAVTMHFGSDDGLRVFLDGDEVLSRKVNRGVAPNQDRHEVELAAGSHEILLKIVNTGGQSGFYFRLEEHGPTPTFAVQDLLGRSVDSKDPKVRESLRRAYRRRHSEEFRELEARRAALAKKRQDLEASVPTTLVYKETAKPRPAHLLKRGLYSEKGELVERATPEFLPPFPESASHDRAGLADWLLDPNHPLTARVAVNRLWQVFFGRGLVETAEDFGSQGTPPSHPELLDWLALRFVDEGWDLKRTMKRIAMSRSYRQSSKSSGEDRRRDPHNVDIARGPRYRLDAEALRDQALALSGLLVRNVGGPGVKPPQPPGLWKAVGYVGSNTDRFVADREPAQVHRRSLYTFWKRTAPPPQMIDAPTRESCVVRRERTNSPLHALMLLNDPQYLEAAHALSARVNREAGPELDQRLKRLWSLALGQDPNSERLAILRAAYEDQRRDFSAQPKSARAFLSIGADEEFDGATLADRAASVMVASLVLNLDVVLNKN